MKRLLTLFLFFLALPLLAVEGKWTPQQVMQLDPDWLKSEGLQISPRQVWDPVKGEGLLSATLSVGGCSASFISPDGLFITNHHCLFSILQEHATPADDIITRGYYAASRDKELTGKSLRLLVDRGFTDVTAQVQAAVPKGADDLARHDAIEKKVKSLIADCEKRPATRCTVSELEGGLTYTLIDAMEFSDIRLVYAPARAIGEFGGEVDNWMWPRHTGDFAIGRVYTNKGTPGPYQPGNEPYHPAHPLVISTAGVKPGDFVMIMGYPGITYRAFTAEEMAERRDLFFARRIDVYGEWVRILEEAGRESPAAAIAVADTLKTLDNRFKNAQGQIAGFSREHIVEKQRVKDQQTLAWIAAHPEMRSGKAAHDELMRVLDEKLRLWDHDYLLSNIAVGPKGLSLATAIVHNAGERKKSDLEREPEYMERNQSRLHDKIEREQKNYWPTADRRVLQSWLGRAAALPKGQRIGAVEPLTSSPDSDRTGVIEALYRDSRVFDLGERMKMFAESVEQLHARKDPLLELAFALDVEIRQLKEREDRRAGALNRLRPAWRRAVIAAAGKQIAPDANSTLRISFGHVKGYGPRDAVWYEPQSTLSGVVQKNTGQEPFVVPAPVLEAAKKRDPGPWLDPALGDVPVDFLADLDTTGGNSGSPVVNGRGELVGVNFDRVWENVAGDFGYLPDVGRNVSVDIRYLLWILDRVENADALLRELGVRR